VAGFTKIVVWLVAGGLGAILAASAGAVQTSSDPLIHADELIQAHQLQKAEEVLADLVEREPGNLGARIKLGQVQTALGLNEDAMKSFEAVLAVDPRSTAARDGEVDAAEKAALADQSAGIEGSALLRLIQARKFVPDSPRLLLDFGVQAEKMRIYADADAALKKAHDLAPEDAKIIYALAHVEFDEQNMQAAEAHLREYLKMRPDDATAHYGLGRLLHMVTRNDEAKAELGRSIELQPRQISSYYELGEIALDEKLDGEAKADYEKVLSFSPHHGGALTGMGIIAFRKKDYATAQQYLQSAVQYASDYPKAHYYYALVLTRLGRADEAKRESDLATALGQQQNKEIHGNSLTVIQ